MSGDPYMPLFVGDFMASTATWTGPERGLYLQLLAFAWTAGTLPADLTRLARAVNYSPEEFGALWPVMREKFTNGDGKLTNGRLERVRAGIAEYRSERAKNAKRAAGMRWHRQADASSTASSSASSNASSNPIHSIPFQSESIPNHANPKPKRGAGRGPPRKRCPEGFAIDENLKAWALLNCPDIDLQRELAAFKDWEFKSARTDWPAAWRNWMRKAQESAPSARAAAISTITWRPPPDQPDLNLEAPEPPP